MRSRSHWDYGFLGSKLRSRLSMTSWMLLSILSVPVCGEDVEVTERFTSLGSDIHISAGCELDVWVRPGESWIHWIMGCGAAGSCAGG